MDISMECFNGIGLMFKFVRYIVYWISKYNFLLGILKINIICALAKILISQLMLTYFALNITYYMIKLS